MVPVGVAWRAGILFTLTGPKEAEQAQVAVLDLRTDSARRFSEGVTPSIETGHLVFALAGTLHVVPFDLERLEPRGEALPMVDNAWVSPAGAANYSVSTVGTLVYAQARTDLPVAHSCGSIVAGARHRFPLPRERTRGTCLARWRENRADRWRRRCRYLDLGRCPRDGDTADVRSGNRSAPNLDARQQTARLLVTTRWRQAQSVQTRRRWFGDCRAAHRERRFTLADIHSAEWSRHCGFIVNLKTAADVVWFRPPGHQPEPLVQTRFIEHNAELSPNGRYIAYQSNESGGNEIDVRPFPNVNDGRWQVSVGGGTRPSWARNGRELFDLDLTNRLTVAPVETAGPTFSSGNPANLFQTLRFAAHRATALRPVAGRQSVPGDKESAGARAASLDKASSS